MADTYAVVQRRGPPGGAGAQAAHGPDRALYSRVAPRASRAPGGADDPGSRPGAPAGSLPSPECAPLPRTDGDPGQTAGGPVAPGAYEDVSSRAPGNGLGFNLRIGRPKGPRDPPAEWTRV